jgi:hypothetical protein
VTAAQQTDDAEEQVDDVVEHGDLEDAQQRRLRMMPGEHDGVEILGDAGDEPEDAYEQEHRAEDSGDDLNLRPGGARGRGDRCCDIHGCPFVVMWST